MAELGLYDGTRKLGYVTWEAHRKLAETLHHKLRDLLSAQSLEWSSIAGVVVYKGPGSFTGLRIGLSVANALSSGETLPISAQTGHDWIEKGVELLAKGESDDIALPEYGAPVHITQPKK
jgi:tRNA threonylcarbamoyladenosine biosynthesis protein TsaB